ncbi:hypothetical protein F5Y19DRAFT_447046 [Xylariaceae sp. FL1651]|nr:hypothetical protein F5Y19DRAFT_447046 [Xylariaceae sp. FL1651]
MYTKTIVLVASALTTAVVSSPAPRALMARDPSDKSGTSQMAFKCEGLTLPDPSTNGGSSYFQSSLGLFHNGGDKIYPSACTQEDAFCSNCKFDDLGSGTNVTACWNPPAGKSGCGIEFTFHNYHFNSQNSEPYCGHTNSFGAFSDTITAICYFNTTGTVEG